MQQSELDDLPASSELDEIIAHYLEASAAGDTPDRCCLLVEHPELAAELRAFFDDHDWMAGLANPNVPAQPSFATAATLVPTIDDRRYVNLHPHARGGLGEVLCATDREFNRVVALKRLQERYAHDPQSQRRFLMEAEITARLEHPGVVPVHSMFQDQSGRPSYVMRFVDGDTLADAIAAYHAGPADAVPFRRLMQSFVQVCRTIGYAHSRGIIHRDLKPSNIMLGKFGETLVVDWGLSKVIGRTDDLRSISSAETLRPVSADSSGRHETQMGSAVGTPAYMSPEQAAGRWDVIGLLTDVYGLGAVLYVLLTGRPPLEGDNWPEMNQRIQRGDIQRPRDVNNAVPQALQAICLKAMALMPEDRYPSAEDLATDIERWLADEPVQAYREPIVRRLSRWARHHKPLVSGGIAFAITAVIAGWTVSLAHAKKDAFSDAARTSTWQMQAVQKGYENELKTLRSLEQYMGWFAMQVDRTIGRDKALPASARDALYLKSVEFWDDAINRDEELQAGGTIWNVYYRLQRAQCLARAGDTESAIAEAAEAAERRLALPFDWMPDVLRVYAIAVERAEDDGRRREYTLKAREFVVQMARDDYFGKAPAALQRLRQDSELNQLLSHELIDAYLRTLPSVSTPHE